MAVLAEEAFDEQFLNCPVCLDTYNDPRLLQCFHVFCQQCLVPLGIRDHQGQPTVSCPTCGQVTPLTDRGVAGLHSAFHTNQLLRTHRDFGKNQVTSKCLGREKDANPARDAMYCFQHIEEELKFYCEVCGELVCLLCTDTGKHAGHHCSPLERAFERYKEEITPILESMEEHVATIRKALAHIAQRRGEISDQRAAIEDNVHDSFDKLRDVLSVRETELINQLHQITCAKLKGLAEQSDQIEVTLSQLNSCLHFMRESIKVTARRQDVLMVKTTAVNKAKKLNTPLRPELLKPETEADMIFLASKDLTGPCREYGKMLALGLPDPMNCYATGEGVERAVVRMKSVAILQAYNNEGKPCEESIKTLECEFESETAGTKASCSVQRRGQTQYEITYQPTTMGRHQLHIKVDGQHIKGSPFSVLVKLPLEKLAWHSNPSYR